MANKWYPAVCSALVLSCGGISEIPLSETVGGSGSIDTGNPTGGVSNTGGAFQAGGAPVYGALVTGGSYPIGGTTAIGGTSHAGGASPAGGSSASGGTSSVAAGGKSTTGGSGRIDAGTPTGGRTGIGGSGIGGVTYGPLGGWTMSGGTSSGGTSSSDAGVSTADAGDLDASIGVDPCPVDDQSNRTVLAVIDQTASTNAPGVQVVVYDDQSADRTITVAPRNWGMVIQPRCFPPGSPEVSACIASFQGVTSGALIPTRNDCGKSVSFGTETYITINGTTSGDIQCAMDSTSVAIQIYASCEPLCKN
jgi:hypothetical protein